jgi:hypothetical protein
LKTLLDRPDPMRIGNLATCGTIHGIQSINGCASLRVDARERDQKIFAVKAGQDVVKQAEPVRCLNLNKRINRMRFVIDCNPRRKFNSCRKTMALVLGFFD